MKMELMGKQLTLLCRSRGATEGYFETNLKRYYSSSAGSWKLRGSELASEEHHVSWGEQQSKMELGQL